MQTYFNEHDKFAANWLRNLFPEANVDDRDIQNVSAADVAGFQRAHWFGGIGGWELALQLADWPSDREVWTGSCPCQPFSTAGKRKGAADERHLWPEWFRLIGECRPDTIFGEQVASAISHGWLDGISADLEREGYAVGSVVLGAHSVGAPHIRQRLWWVAHANGTGWEVSQANEFDTAEVATAFACSNLRLSDSNLPKQNEWPSSGQQSLHHGHDGNRRRLEYTTSHGRQEWRPESNWWGTATRCGSDGVTRRIEPGIEPLVDGIPKRMDKLRGYGNAIVPQVAATFIRAFMSANTIE